MEKGKTQDQKLAEKIKMTQASLRNGEAIFNKSSSHMSSLNESLGENPDVVEELNLNFNWGYLYDIPLSEMVEGFADKIGLKSEIESRFNDDISIPEFARHLEREVEKLEVKGVDLEEFKFIEDDVENSRFIFGCMRVSEANRVCKNTYGKNIEELLSEAKRDGNTDAFCTAVQVDQFVLASKSADLIIDKARIEGDSEFFKKLSLAIDGEFKPEKLTLGNDRLREVLIYAEELVEAGEAEKLTGNAAFSYFVKESGLYADGKNDSFDAFKNALSRFYTRLKKIKDR